MIERLRVPIPAGAAGEFSSPELTLCADSYSESVPSPVLPQWHVKDTGHSATSAGGRHLKHAYTGDPTKSEWTDYAAVQAYCENLAGNELERRIHSATIVSAR